MLRPPIRVSKPAILPVSVEEAARACRLENSEADDSMALEIEAATDRLDGYRGILGRALINQVWRRDYVPDCRNLYRLPFPDVSEASAEAIGADGAAIPISAVLDRDTVGSFVRLTAAGGLTVGSLLRVTFTAGYGPNREDVPAAIRQAILMDVAYRYHSTSEDGQIRSETVDGLGTTAFNSPEQAATANARMIADLLKPFRLRNLP